MLAGLRRCKASMVWAWCRREECTVSTSRSSFSPTPPKSSSKSSAPTICPPNGNPGGLLWRPAADTTAQRHLDLVVVVAHLVILVSLGLSHLLLVEVHLVAAAPTLAAGVVFFALRVTVVVVVVFAYRVRSALVRIRLL